MKQIIIGGHSDPLSKTNTEYNMLMGGTYWYTSAFYGIIPTNGKFRNLSVELSGVPGTNPYVIGLYVNGALTTCAATIDAAATTGFDADEISVSAGDRISIQSSFPSGAPDNTPYARWSVEFESDTPGETIILGTGQTYKSSNTYNCMSCEMTGLYVVTESQVYQLIATNGNFKKLYVMVGNPGVDPDGYNFKLRIDGADSDDGAGNPLEVTITAPNTTGNDTVHVIPVAAGSFGNFKCTPLNVPANDVNIRWGMVFSPDIDGESLILGGEYGTLNTSNTRYNYLETTTYNNSWASSELFQGAQDTTPDMIIKKFYVRLTAAPGAGGSGKKYTFTIRHTGADSAITVEILEVATTGNDIVNEFACLAYDELGIKCVPLNTPSAAYACWGAVIYIEGESGSGPLQGNMAGRLVGANII